MKNKTQNSETIWAYIAGLVDGEGYFKIRHIKNSKLKRGYAREFLLTITNTSKPLLLEVQKQIGLGKIYTHNPKNGNANTGYTLRFFAGNCRIILPNIIPYLLLKKKLAEVLLESLNIIRSTHPSKIKEKRLMQLEKKYIYEFSVYKKMLEE